MEKIIDLLRDLGEKVGQTVDVLWPQYLQYLVVAAVTQICIWSILLVVVVVAFHRVLLFKFEDDDARGLSIGAVGLTAIIVLIIWIIVVSIDVPIMLNPVGFAVGQILGGK